MDSARRISLGVCCIAVHGALASSGTDNFFVRIAPIFSRCAPMHHIQNRLHNYRQDDQWLGRGRMLLAWQEGIAGLRGKASRIGASQR